MSNRIETTSGLWSLRRVVIGFLVMGMAVGSVYGQVKDMYGNAVNNELCNQFAAFDYDAEVEQLVSKILGVFNIDNAYKIRACGNVKNAVALEDKGVPVILYNPEFLNKIKSYSFSESDLPSDSEDWAVLLVLAHEIGHHLNGHVTNPPPGLSEWGKELKADENAGFCLYLLNAPNLETARKGLMVVSEKGSRSHPPRQQRLDSFKEGWDKAAKKYPRPGRIAALNCAFVQRVGVLVAGQGVSGVRLVVSYTGGDGGVHGGQSVVSSGVMGLIATVAAGRFAEGSGTLEYLLTGVPFSSGRVEFGLNIGGKSCTVTMEVEGGSLPAPVVPAPKPVVPEVVDHGPMVGKMILVKGGTFEMGCTGEQEGCEDDEKPVHRVTLGDYYLGETEVTQAQWRAVMGYNPSNNTSCDQCPVEQVSWNEVQDFLRRLNERSGGLKYRLPTEAEWEYAARGGKESRGYRYAGSNNLDEVGWYNSNSGRNTHPVKGKRSNELGLYDMSGNVSEWCSDRYKHYSSSAKTNPVGAARGSDRVYRVGSWLSLAADCRVAFRSGITPDYRSDSLGFRLARTY